MVIVHQIHTVTHYTHSMTIVYQYKHYIREKNEIECYVHFANQCFQIWISALLYLQRAEVSSFFHSHQMSSLPHAHAPLDISI